MKIVYQIMDAEAFRMIGDGNCLFRSFSYFLFNTQNFHFALRRNIKQDIFNNWERYSGFLNFNTDRWASHSSFEYRTYISQDGVYSGEPEIQSFVELVNVTVYIFMNDHPIPRIYSCQVEINYTCVGPVRCRAL